MAEGLWGVDELVKAARGELIGTPRGAFTGVSIDSRSVGDNEIFVAIKGDRMDGHDFAAAALAAGAGIAIVSRVDDAMRAAGALLVVDDPLAALTRMAQAARARSVAKIVGVTGSVGKTGTKEALKLALSGSGLTHASAASFNNHWGVPLSLARLPRDAAFAVFEIGMNHAGEIRPLVKLVQPHVAIITTIAPSHLGNFDSLDGIAAAKAEIFEGVVEGGAVLLNRDNEYFGWLSDRARKLGIGRVYGFGRDAAADVRLDKVALHEDCSCLSAHVFGEPLNVKLGAPGEHVALNSLAVLGAVQLMGADLALGALALSRLEPPKGRGVRHKLKARGGVFSVVDESYNANPASMKAALALLARVSTGKAGRRIAVLGDMLELGSQGPELHAGLAKTIDELGIDTVYAAGPLMRHLWDALAAGRRGVYAASAAQLAESLINDVQAGDAVMIKGSLGSRMGPLVEALRTQFPQAEEG
jgi:UDP-N-acetylmuramoyl-tripeptide--D-alanyl-D-alanine ligase